MASGTRTIGILLFDDVEELDAVGPWEVLAAWTTYFPDDGWAVTTLSRGGGPIRCAKGLALVAHHSMADCPPLAVLVHPGGQGTRPQTKDEAHLDWVRAQVKDEAHLDWVRQQAATAELMTSVCTGSLVYAAAGLLRDRPATTHWGSLDHLARLDPSIEVRPDERWVDDGDVITSAGVSAGIDMALHLVGRLASPDRSAEVRHIIQYDPAPPH